MILTNDRADAALRAVDSLADNDVGVEVLVVDQDSAPAEAQTLATGCAGLDHVRVRRLERNLGCAGGRRLAPAATTGEFILFLDDDAELTPGSLDALVADLDAHPETQAVSATVIQSHGVVLHSGGTVYVADGVAEFSLVGGDLPASAAVPPSGPAGWVPGTAALIRREVLEQVPVDDEMAVYFEDNDWSLRVTRRWPDAFRRSAEAVAIHTSPKRPPEAGFAARSLAADHLGAHARFFERHRLLLAPSLFEMVPELVDEHGERDIAAARLLMELVLARGSDWAIMEWMNGGLASLLGGRSRVVAHQRCSASGGPSSPGSPAWPTGASMSSARPGTVRRRPAPPIRRRDAVSAAAEQAELLASCTRAISPCSGSRTAAGGGCGPAGSIGWRSPHGGRPMTNTITLAPPEVLGGEVQFDWSVTPATQLYKQTSFDLRFPPSVALARVPESLWWRIGLMCLHAHWPLLRPCRVVLPVALPPEEVEFWLRLTDAAVATRSSGGVVPTTRNGGSS